MRLLPLVQIAVVWILFHEGVVNVSAPAAAGTAIWIGFAVMPALHTARRRHFKNWVEGGRPLCAPTPLCGVLCTLAMLPLCCSISVCVQPQGTLRSQLHRNIDCQTNVRYLVLRPHAFHKSVQWAVV